MAAELIFAPETQQDIDEAYCWYEDRRPGFGDDWPARQRERSGEAGEPGRKIG